MEKENYFFIFCISMIYNFFKYISTKLFCFPLSLKFTVSKVNLF